MTLRTFGDFGTKKTGCVNGWPLWWSYVFSMNCSNIGVNILVGNLGGSSWTTCLNCSNGVFQVLYGNFPVDISIIEIPKDQISDRTS